MVLVKRCWFICNELWGLLRCLSCHLFILHSGITGFIEAEKFNGPSIVLAYLPYNSELDNTLTVLQETKKAVDSGYWPLYRYNPRVQNEADAFKLDSSNLRKQLSDF